MRPCMFSGVNLLSESNLVAGVLLNVMFLLGTFTFAVVLGVVSDDISSEVKVSTALQQSCSAACELHPGEFPCRGRQLS